MPDKLSDEEVAAVRLIIETDKRRVWLMSSVRSAASWIVIVVGGIVLLWDSFVKLIKGVAGQ